MSSAQRLETLSVVLNGLMRRYKERVPDVQIVVNAMRAEGILQSEHDVEADHVAFRTMGVAPLGIDSLEKIFLHYGYQKRDQYNFVSKKVTSYWYAPPSPHFPRVFLSQLRVHELSEAAASIIYKYTSTITSDPVDALDLDNGHAVDEYLHSPLWHCPPTWSDYQLLASESEFASWVLCNRHYLNHFAMNVDNLPVPYNTIEHCNALVERHSIALNTAGGKIKTSPDGRLVQSSTVASAVDMPFDTEDGHRSVSGSYLEFVERRVLPEYRTSPWTQPRREHRREGFEAANADKIFESTYTNQTTVP